MADNTPFGAIPRYAFDASGNVIGLVGPDGNISLNNFSKNTLVLFGDSRTEANNIATPEQFSARGFWCHASQILGGQVTVLANSGVAGDTSTQMLARIQTDVWDYEPAFCLMHGCFYNDVSAGTAAATIIANLTAMFNGNAARGITTVYGLEPGSSNHNTAIRKATLATVNNAIINYAKTARNFILVDTWNVLCDPASGSMLAAYSTDGTHNTTLGSVALGRAYAAALANFVTGNRYLCNASGDYYNAITNGIMYGDNASGARAFANGTGITGTGPDRWTNGRTGTATAVGSKVARTDFRQGDWYQLAVTGGSAGDYVYARYADAGVLDWAANTQIYYLKRRKPTVANGYHYVCTTVAGGLTHATTEPTWPTTLGDTVVDNAVTWMCVAAWEIGDTVEHSIEFEADSFSGPALISLVVVYYTSGSVVIKSAGDNIAYTGDTRPSFIPTSGVLKTPQHVIPADTAIIYYEVRIITDAAVTGNVRIANASFRVVE